MMGKTVFGIWGATMQEYLDLRAAYLAYWEILADAAQSGFQFWDMGRNPINSNVSKFKRQWGSVSKPIYQQIVADKVSQQNHDIVTRVQSDNKYQIFMKIWPKLPFPVVQHVGPVLRRHVPFA
jgi:lipid II:glycine glycyltransferase (peptidoglycan interpeptide bridge formation enzyme)